MGDGRDGASHVYCVDEASGETLWTSESVGKTGGNYAGTKSTPALDLVNGRLYALGQFGDLVCLSMTDGKEIWRKSLSGDFGGKFSNWNYAESPLLDGNRLIVTPGGRRGAVVALNTANGSAIWQSRQFTDEAQYVSTVPATLGLRPHYIQMSAKTLVGLDAESGSLLWRIPRAGKTAVIPSPVIHGNIVFVTSGYNIGCSAYQINNQGGRVSTRQLYANKDLVNHHGGVVVVDKYVYGHSDRGGWKCMDITNGRVMWQNSGVGKGSVVYADGHLICRSETGSGTISLVEATPQEYREKSRFNQPDRTNKNSWPHPVVANGKLFIRDQEVLLCFNLRGN
jgi:outer membrane protein assembly factor BamB